MFRLASGAILFARSCLPAPNLNTSNFFLLSRSHNGCTEILPDSPSGGYTAAPAAPSKTLSDSMHSMPQNSFMEMKLNPQINCMENLEMIGQEVENKKIIPNRRASALHFALLPKPTRLQLSSIQCSTWNYALHNQCSVSLIFPAFFGPQIPLLLLALFRFAFRFALH